MDQTKIKTYTHTRTEYILKRWPQHDNFIAQKACIRPNIPLWRFWCLDKRWEIPSVYVSYFFSRKKLLQNKLF